MKRIGKRLLTCILMALCALCLVLAACGETEKIEFSFETNGGPSIETVYVDKGETYTLPTPQREGSDFEGWYENAEFSGTPVTEVVAESSKKFYAKWEQLYEIKLELDGGTLATGKLYAKAGAVIYDAVKDLVPTKDGWQFDDWYLGNTRLSRAAQMQAEAVTLTAHYKVGYTVEIYKQNTELDGYEKQEEDYVGYAEITAAPFTPNVTVTGFDLAAEQPTDGAAPAITSKVLSATPSENVFRLYYDRKLVDVTIAPDYPDGQTGAPIQMQVRYGCEMELPVAEFKADGYFLYAWSAMDAEGNTDIIESDYIKSLLINADGGDAEYSEIVFAGDYISFTALWSKGYTDMMRGVDRIYLFHEDDTVCYLERYGKYFEGEYSPEDRSVRFYDESNDIRMEARLKTNGTFIYAVSTRDAQTFTFYTVEDGINEDIQIRLDEYDGLTYRDTQENIQSKGTYTIDEDSNYFVTFTEGEFQGQTRVLRLLRTTVNSVTRNLFQFRNEDEYEMPTLRRALVAEQSGHNVVTYYESYLSIDLDGYGVAVMDLGDGETANYYYTRTEEALTLYNTSGRVYGVCKFVTIRDYLCYIAYTEAMDVTYTSEDGTLELDGVSEAIYRPSRPGANTVTGSYTYTASIFGGNIVTVVINYDRYVFLVKSVTSGDGEDTVTTYTFEQKPDGYAEYYHTDGRYINFTPIIVINETAEGRASVYGASGTSSQHAFHKVAEGAYKYESKYQTYALTLDDWEDYPEGILESPVDLHNLAVIVFGVNTVRTNTGLNHVAYWQSIKCTGDEAENDLTTTYTGKVTRGSETVDATLSLVGGFAILKIGTEDWKVGSYSTSDGVTTVNIGLTENTSRFYVELNDGDGEKTFTHLNKLLGSARERNADGTSNSNVTFEFDGKGGATLVTQQTEGEPIRVAGSIEEQDDIEGVEGTVYLFTPTAEGDTQAFRFVLLTSGSYTYFTRETEDYVGEYTETDGTGTLTLDGFGFRGTFTVEGEDEPLVGVYSIVDADNHIVRVMVGSDPYYFDISGKNYVVRGSEYGAYMFIVNYANNGYLLRLDGHWNATLEKDEAVVANGTYSEKNGVYTLNLTLEATVAGINTTYTGALGEVIQNNLRYNAFLVEFSNARNVYVDRTEWTVLMLDGFGNAVRFGQYGGAERGTYTVLTDDLIYYANSASTDACIYRYSDDGMMGEIVMQKYTAQGYYTQNLDALLFTEYGFMQFNGTTRYYYEMDDEGNVTIYRRAFGETNANEYGFRKFDIGVLGDQLDLHSFDSEGFGEALYYSADGYAITFKRAESDTYDGTHFKYPVTVSETDETRYPLEDLVFAPTGGDSFSVRATIIINGKDYTGTIHRAVVKNGDTDEATSTEWYLTNGNLRFDLKLHYQGAEDATYEITQLRNIQTYQSNMYLDVYLMLLLLLGYPMPDSFGTITLVTEFNEDGTPNTAEGGKYITSAFGQDSALYGYELEKQPYEYDEKTHIYTVELPEKKAASEEESSAEEPAATYKYRLYFRLDYNSTYLQLGYLVGGYTILAYTREETLQTEGETQYTVTAERVLYGDTNAYVAGDYYSVTLKKGEETIAAYNHLLTVGDALYYVVYTRSTGEDAKITAAKYYELKFTEEDSGSLTGDEVKLLKSVAVHEIEAEVYYTDGGSYAEVITDEKGEKKIVHVYYSQDYTVTECTYDEASDTFTVTTSTNRKLAVKITNKENKTIEITEVTEEQA